MNTKTLYKHWFLIISVTLGSAGGDVQGLKRPHDNDTPQETKKPRLEEPVSTNILEEALSDISDDADDILNREDVSNLKTNCHFVFNVNFWKFLEYEFTCLVYYISKLTVCNNCVG